MDRVSLDGICVEVISIVKHVKLEREDAKKRKKVFAWFRR